MMRILVKGCCAACLVLLCAAPAEAGWGITDPDLVRRLGLRIESVVFPPKADEAVCSVASLALRASLHVPGPTLVLFLAGGASDGRVEPPDRSSAIRASAQLTRLLNIEGADACAIHAGSDQGVHVAFRLFRILSVDVSSVSPKACPAVNRIRAPAVALRSADSKVTRVWEAGPPITRRALLEGMLETLGPAMTPRRVAREGYALLESARDFVRLQTKIESPDGHPRLEKLRISIREREAELGAKQFVDLDPWHLQGVPLVYVAQGAAILGSEAFPPRRTADIQRSFLIGRHEITNTQYAAFLADSGYDGATAHPSSREPYLDDWVDGEFVEGRGRHPICCVSWHHASAYCRWLSERTGRRVRLPTEAEWEYAARGEEGRTYPWGDVWDPKACNWGDGGSVDAFAGASPVGSFPSGATHQGVHDLAGNVWEWCADAVRDVPDDIGTRTAGDADAEAPRRPLRGGPWCLGAEALRSDHPWYATPSIADDKIGFRILVEIDP